MRRRPLAFLCLAAALFLTVAGLARVSERKSALLAAQEYLTDMAGTEGVLILEGSVSEVYAVSDGVRLFVDEIRIFQSGALAGTLSPRLKLMLTVGTDTYLPGDRIRVSGSWKPFTEAGNPGQFDTQEYYFVKNTLGSISGPAVSLLTEGKWSLIRMLSGIRRTLRGSYLKILEEKAARTVSAISLGEKSFMEQEWKQLYQEGGIAHIISISGLHISLIGMCIYKLLRRIRLPFVLASLPSAVFVILYALMSGFGISSVRACLMFILWLGSQIVGRKNDMLTSTAIAAALILTGNPYSAVQSSFLLSFGAILSIALLVPVLTEANPFRSSPRREVITHGAAASRQAPAKERFQERVDRKNTQKDQSVQNQNYMQNSEHAQNTEFAQSIVGEKAEFCLRRLCLAGDFLWEKLSGGLGIWIGTLPVTLWFFYQTSPWSILANLAVIPLMSALMASALLSCLAGLISVSLGTFLAAPVYYLLGFFEWLCTIEQQLPGAIWIAGRPALWRIAVYYALLIGAAAGTVTILRAQSSRKRLGQAQACQPERRIRSRAGQPEDRFHAPSARRIRSRADQPEDRFQAPSARQIRSRADQPEDRFQAPSTRQIRSRADQPEDRFQALSARRTYRATAVPQCTPAILWILAFVLCIFLMGFHPRSHLAVTCLDVGQGDGALIQLPDGTNCLIDGGSTSVSSLWEYRISQTVKYYGISTIDYIFLSHADSDHISGIEEYLEDYLPGFAQKNAHGISLKNLVLPPTADESDFDTLTERCRELGITVLRMEAGAVLGNAAAASEIAGQSAGDSASDSGQSMSSATSSDIWSMTCMAPSSIALSGDKNEDSMVLLLQYGNFRMLFTGDLEGDSEQALAASGADISCDVLKVGHHGSRGASSEVFLAAVSPAFGIISCGENNTYGHPAAAAVERLSAAGVTLYATMDCGAMTVRSDGKNYLIYGYLGTEEYKKEGS